MKKLATVLAISVALLTADLAANAGAPCDPSPDCVCGVSTVTVGTGAFVGYWCYTIEASWDSDHGLSHLNILTDLPAACRCEEELITFDTPAGTSQGFEDENDTTPCFNTYTGEYNCMGDPSLGSPLDQVAAIKFEPDTECDDKIGTGTFTFYSQAAPAGDENTVHTAVIVDKNGNGECTGSVTGPLPGIECAVHTIQESLGSVRKRFEE